MFVDYGSGSTLRAMLSFAALFVALGGMLYARSPRARSSRAHRPGASSSPI